MIKTKAYLPLTVIFILISISANSIKGKSRLERSGFKAVAFYTAKNDKAHISFVHEANRWFSKKAGEMGFIYDSTDNWNNMNDSFLSEYDVVIFLDTRPDSASQREAFKRYMKNGGSWMGFHFAAFALTPSMYPQNWDWYHDEFLGAGQYAGNTWAPTSAILRVERKRHPVMKGIPPSFASAPNEWYKWENDLRSNPDIEILLSIDASSFPLGTGPKLHEIWHEGYYPVAWSNKKFNMLYINMGHNVIDYDNKTDRELSFTFENDVQNRLVINGLLWLDRKKTNKDNNR